MNEIDKKNLSDQRKLRLNKIRKIENYLTHKLIKENYAVKTEKICFCFRLHRQDFNCLNSKTGGVCIISHATVVASPIGIASAEFSIVFSLEQE